MSQQGLFFGVDDYEIHGDPPEAKVVIRIAPGLTGTVMADFNSVRVVKDKQTGKTRGIRVRAKPVLQDIRAVKAKHHV